jgi:hypothetical protein
MERHGRSSNAKPKQEARQGLSTVNSQGFSGVGATSGTRGGSGKNCSFDRKRGRNMPASTNATQVVHVPRDHRASPQVGLRAPGHGRGRRRPGRLPTPHCTEAQKNGEALPRNPQQGRAREAPRQGEPDAFVSMGPGFDERLRHYRKALVEIVPVTPAMSISRSPASLNALNVVS